MPAQARDIIPKMPAAFRADKAGSAKALIQLVLNGDGGGNWVIDVSEGQCAVREETLPNPNVQVAMEATHFVSLIQGQLNPLQAFMSGKIKVSGNVGHLMQMMNWFELG